MANRMAYDCLGETCQIGQLVAAGATQFQTAERRAAGGPEVPRGDGSHKGGPGRPGTWPVHQARDLLGRRAET
eukprot:scaffold571363_cov19-Prasinocladus_malaysianus.AAC.1